MRCHGKTVAMEVNPSFAVIARSRDNAITRIILLLSKRRIEAAILGELFPKLHRKL